MIVVIEKRSSFECEKTDAANGLLQSPGDCNRAKPRSDQCYILTNHIARPRKGSGWLPHPLHSDWLVSRYLMGII